MTQSMSRIQDSLQQSFRRHRLVFWYDVAGEWRSDFESFAEEGVSKLSVEGNEFGIKVKILRHPDSRQRFLIYSSAARPPEEENWLLDLLLQGHEFKADRASLAIQEVGLPYEFRNLAEDHGPFFKSSKRTSALGESISKGDTQDGVRMQMMGILAGAPPEIDAILLKLLQKSSEVEMFDPVEDCLGSSGLVSHFWKAVERVFAYASGQPSLRDFLVTLFRSANPFDPQVKLPAHARVFLQRWTQNSAHEQSFRETASRMEKELQIGSHLESLRNPVDLGESDTFEIFDKYLIHSLCRTFEDGGLPAAIRQTCQRRKVSFWYPQHRNGYLALDRAAEMRELIDGAELQIDSLASGIDRYTTTWWRIDRAYREFCLHCRRYGQVNVLEQVAEWVEKSYITNFLLPLADAWGDRVRDLSKWKIDSIPAQREFFTKFVKPFLDREQKLFVIISDALRFEAAADVSQRLESENRYSAEVSPMLASLPSYTQLGMASLLPGAEWAVNPADQSAQVDGRNATGTENRREILQAALQGKGTAILAEHFLALNSKTEGRALLKDHDVIYIYHNVIDKIGDSAMTESKTTDAVESAFDELIQIVKKVAAINCNNMVLTADHGFLFQQDPVHESDTVALPARSDVFAQQRRFLIAKEIEKGPGVKVFSSEALGLSGEWSAAFPVSLGRFPLKGSGKRYVHGGFSLQEVIVPVVRIHKARADDTGRVDADLLRVPSKITTGQISLAIYQEQPITLKLLSRQLKVGVFARTDDGKETELSDIKSVLCESKESEPRLRETIVNLAITAAIDQFNNRTVEIRLLEILPGTNQSVIYKRYPIKVQKSFTSDFDDA